MRCPLRTCSSLLRVYRVELETEYDDEFLTLTAATTPSTNDLHDYAIKDDFTI
jgi:hypothetical protein